MQRAVLLFLLFLLPLEVFEGIAYELKLAQEAKQETSLHSPAESRATQADSTPSDPARSALQSSLFDSDPELVLDLGEAFDVPCTFVRKPPPLIASPPSHASYCDKSVVSSVPTPPAI